jgi:hypothetical protein
MNNLFAFILGMLLAVWVTDSDIEARVYNHTHRANLTTWDAMWLNLDDL